MKNKYLIETFSFLLILLFFYTGVSKLTELSFFRAQLRLYPYIHAFGPIIAIGIPLLELAIAILLVSPYDQTRRIGFRASTILLSLFTLYLLTMVATQPHLPCSCGGVISKLSWKQHIGFNLVFIAFSILGSRLIRIGSGGSYSSRVKLST